MKRNSGLKIDMTGGLTGSDRARIIPALVSALLVFPILAESFYQGSRLWEIEVGRLGLLVPGILLIALFFLLLRGDKASEEGAKNGFARVYVLPLAILLIAVLLIIFFGQQVREGAGAYANQFMGIRTELTGRIQNHYAQAESAGAGLLITTAAFSVLLASISLVFAMTGGIVGGLAVCAAVLIPILAKIAVPTAVLAVLGFAVAAGYIIKSGRVSGVVSSKGIAQGTGFFAVTAVVLALILAFTGAGSALAGLIGQGTDEAGNFYHNAKYEQRDNIMPEGDLPRALAFEPSGRTSLVITMSEPEGTYLRGYVGESFDGVRWTGLPDEDVREQSDTFYWLHNAGFYGQSQESLAYDSADTEEPPEKAVMTVSNVSACSRYVYIPYGYAGGDGFADERGIGDTDILATGTAPYSLSYTTAAVRNSYKLQKAMSEEDPSKAAESGYPELEYAYRKTVYDSYLDIPDSLRKTLEEELGEAEELSTTEAKIRILDYLDSNVSYDSEMIIDTDDVVTTFLTEEKEGQSVHYATAAAMILRYYGIPARYAEGFIIPGGLADSVLPGEPIEVKEEYAHAWTEYYLDGVGWIPFETTPGYRNSNMYAGTDDMEALNEDPNGTQGTGTKKEKKDNKNTNQKIDNPANRWKKIFVFRKAWIIGLILAALLAFALVTALRRLRLRKFRKTFRGEDPDKGLDNAFAYAVMLLSRKVRGLDKSDLLAAADSVGEEFGLKDEYVRAAGLAGRSLFSSHGATEDDRSEMIRFEETVLKTFKSGRNLAQRAFDRLIRCIY